VQDARYTVMPMKNIPLLYVVFLVIGSVVTPVCYAELENDDADLGEFTEGPAWKEGEVILPAFPETDDLLKVEVDRGEMPFSFYLDGKNLSVSKADGITRYTVLIESDSGAKNIMFEGIRCRTREYRTYAYGTYDNKLIKARTSSWQRIPDTGFMIHRYNFYRHYMCDEHRVQHPRNSVLQKVKYPEDFEEHDDR